MDVREVMLAFRRGWWLLALGMVAGGSAALAVSLLSTPLYTSTTQLFVTTTDTTSTTAALQGSQLSQERVSSYAQLLTGEALAERVVDVLDLDLSVQQLREEITAEPIPETVLLDAAVTDPSPERAQRIAEAIGTEFPRLIAELESAGTGQPPVRVRVVDTAQLPGEPSSPQTIRDVVLGTVAGLVIGALIAVARVRLDRTVSDSAIAAEVAGAPVIGVILRDSQLEKRHVVDRTMSGTAEGYRKLRTNLQFVSVDSPPRVIMVTSAMPSEGKSTLVVNLALTLIDAGRTVTVVEADLRKPKVTSYLGLIGDAGLTNILAGSADLDEVIQSYGRGGLSVIAAGPLPPNPSELLASTQMSSLMDKLRGRSDIILVDAPPVLPVADSAGLAVHMDGVLLSVRYGVTRKDQLHQAAVALDGVGARTLGLILNIVPPRADMATVYGYGQSYGHRSGRHTRPE